MPAGRRASFQALERALRCIHTYCPWSCLQWPPTCPSLSDRRVTCADGNPASSGMSYCPQRLSPQPAHQLEVVNCQQHPRPRTRLRMGRRHWGRQTSRLRGTPTRRGRRRRPPRPSSQTSNMSSPVSCPAPVPPQRWGCRCNNTAVHLPALLLHNRQSQLTTPRPPRSSPAHVDVGVHHRARVAALTSPRLPKFWRQP